MASDETILLPDPPPARPARRDMAIEAALRRFDGAEVAPVRASRPAGRRGWVRSPQFGLLVTASLIAAIGLPAAYISIRDGFVSSSEPAASPPAATPSEDAIAAPEPTGSEAAETVTDSAVAVPQKRSNVEIEPAPPTQLRKAIAAPPVAALAPPPPAPPPPAPEPAEPMAEREAEDSSQYIVVTGSRIAQPNLQAADSLAVGGRESRDERKVNRAGTAPDLALEDRAYRTFLGRLQSAVRADDRNGMTELIAYPLRVNSNGRSRTYRNATSVLADYERIFTASVKQAILDQRFEQLFGRDQGVMIGNGALWFDHICRNSQCSPPGPVRIKAINN